MSAEEANPATEGTASGPSRSGPSAAAVPSGRRYVYAVGRVEARFPSTGIEKELVQAARQAPTAGMTDHQAAHAVLTDPANRYLARLMCWVMTIEEIDTYLLVPQDATDLDLLLAAMRPSPHPTDTDAVIGRLGPPAPPDRCNGLVVPMVVFDQLYSFDTEAFLAEIPCPDELDQAAFQEAAGELLQRIGGLADNAGATDEHRALNYLTLRYPLIYARATRQFARNSSLSGVDVLRSPLSGVRTLVDVVFTYTDRTTGVPEKFAARVDVTEEFPFLSAPLAPYFDR